MASSRKVLEKCNEAYKGRGGTGLYVIVNHTVYLNIRYTYRLQHKQIS